MLTDKRLSQIAAESDFDRERRRRAISLIAARPGSGPDDVLPMLPFEEVVAALGRTGETDLGVQTIRLDSIIGTVDRTAGTFDRSFRPANKGVRGGAGSRSQPPGAGASSCPRSTSTGSATCTSCRTVITVCPWPARAGTPRSRLASSE